jgi:site-specific DNA-methyltransferase (adenine-specific)
MELEKNTILFGDCTERLKELPSESIDSFYADPPFDIDFNKIESMYNRKKLKVVKGYNEPTKDYAQFSNEWISECFRVLKKDGSGWICSGWSNLGDVLSAIKSSGFKLVNHLIWKYQFGVYTKKKFITSHYHLLFVAKNPKNWTFNKDVRFKDMRTSNGNANYRDREDVWCIDRPYHTGKEKNANTQPIELVKKALEYTTKKGDLVLDPFMGGATTAVTCVLTGRDYIGFEINKNLKKLQDRRIEDARAERLAYQNC